jgi:hypothetical protein
LAAVLGGLVAGGLLAGCAQEVYKGPRVVHYTEGSFYVRHIPLMTGSATVDAIAADICSRNRAKAVLTDAYQDVPLGIRYATYDCI